MGFIKNLIGGIISFITGLFNKKDNGYYLELKEEIGETSAAPTPIVTAPTPAPQVAKATQPATAAKASKPAKEAKTPTPVAPKIALPTETNFATKYLITPNNGERRRPGANMSGFLDMARQVKTTA